mmetsp:Transcript_1459/g.3736  ORF Transcript_1459/g.3736 Transcript_1459/m.3736 type:complete len:263 (+) Transcript_1459:112-900(+)
MNLVQIAVGAAAESSSAARQLEAAGVSRNDAASRPLSMGIMLGSELYPTIEYCSNRYTLIPPAASCAEKSESVRGSMRVKCARDMASTMRSSTLSGGGVSEGGGGEAARSGVAFLLARAAVRTLCVVGERRSHRFASMKDLGAVGAGSSPSCSTRSSGASSALWLHTTYTASEETVVTLGGAPDCEKKLRSSAIGSSACRGSITSEKAALGQRCRSTESVAPSSVEKGVEVVTGPAEGKRSSHLVSCRSSVFSHSGSRRTLR